MQIAVVGAGWSGLTVARLLTDKGYPVTVIEKRQHLGGNAADETRNDGSIVPKYGAHIFHTQSKRVWDWVNQFSEFNDYVHRVSVSWRGRHLDYPITLDAVNQAYGTEMSAEYAEWFLRDTGKEFMGATLNFETVMLSRLGKYLYDIYVGPYTRKMWGMEPCQLEARLASRVPLRLDNDKRLFQDPYQGFPKEGYHKLFERMAQGIRFQWGDYKKMNLKRFHHIFVTSPLDEWYDYDLGKLEYRGMQFQEEAFATNVYILPTGTVNTNDDLHQLRVEEPKQYYQQHLPFSILVHNYAGGPGNFYPVPTRANDALADQYRQRARTEPNLTFLGRLGQYRYLNQDQAILMAMKEVDQWKPA